MTSDKMPLMMDNTSIPVNIHDVEDLFGDGVGLSLQVRSQSKQLQQRLDELRSRGCCQTVAWSRTGTIASITPDGQTVELRYLRRHPEDGSWDLSDPTPCHLISGTPAIPLVHLIWAGTSSPDLAIIDSVGRVAIISFSIALNHPFLQRKWDTDPIDDAHAAVGAYWLTTAPANPQANYHVMYGPAIKTGNGYSYETSFVNAGFPSHPSPAKSALFTLTTNGTLRMFWSQNNNRLEETTMELESVNSSDELVTHATFASGKRHLLLALSTTAKQLRLIKIEIHWGGATQQDKPPQHNRILNPSLIEKHLATSNWLQGGPNDLNQDSHMAELSHLAVLPSLLDATGKNTVSPVVLTIRSRASNEGPYMTTQSIIDCWEVTEERQTLQSAFETLGSRRNSISSELPVITQLKKSRPITTEKVVIDIHTIHFGKVVVLVFADGTVEHRDRFTLEELYASEDLTKVASLRQVGWNFADEGPCQQVAFSPTHCSMIQMGDDGKIRWNKLHYVMGDIGNTMQDSHYVGTMAGLVVATAPSVTYQNNFDDVLAIVRPLVTKKRFVHDFTAELIRMLKIQVDYSEDQHHDALVRNGSLQSCLSIMNALGFQGDLNPRSIQAKYSLLSLNIRNVVVLVTIASNAPAGARDKISPMDEPEVVDTLVGCARWSQDLIAWLMDSLFELMNDEHFLALMCRERFSEIAGYLHEKGNVSFHVLLSSSSRGFLSAMCRRLVHLEQISTKAIDFYRVESAKSGSTSIHISPRLQRAYQRLQQITSSSLVKVAEFERLLTSLSNEIRQAYNSFLPSLVKAQQNAPQGKQIDNAVKIARVQCELALLLSSSPSPAFLPIMKKLFTKDLPVLRTVMDPARLFFADYTLLEVQDDKHSLAMKKSRGMIYIDVFKRMEMQPSGEQQWRRCTRCTAVMKDVNGSRPGFSFVLTQQRKCSCGGHWMLLPKGVVA